MLIAVQLLCARIARADVQIAQTISFPGIAAHTYGDASFPVSVNASSGLPVTLAVANGPASLIGTTVTLSGAGDVTIVASQAGDVTYLPAAPVSQVFKVAKAKQAIGFTPIPSHAYNDAAFSVSATATSGLAVTYMIASGPATIGGGLVALAGQPGTVVVRATQAGDANFEAATCDQSFTVTAPAGYNILSIQNGTTGAAGGVSGDRITVTATVPAGQYFAGWQLVSGLGAFSDVSNPSATFTMGTTAATVRALLISTPPVYGATWNEINIPSDVTVYDPVSNYPSFTLYTAVITNSGTAPWGPNISVTAFDSAGAIVCWQTVTNASPGGVLPGGKTYLAFGQWGPTSATFYICNYYIGPNVMQKVGAFSTTTKWWNYQAKGGSARPDFTSVNGGLYIQPGTVGTAYSLTPVIRNAATSISVVGTLPPGLALNTTTGRISGTPTTAGVYAITWSATNSSGIGLGEAFISIYPPAGYSVTVQNGSGSVGSLSVGASTQIVAQTAPAGQIFNGWTIVSGPGTVADATSPTTVLTLPSPGSTVVTANYISGYALTVASGTCSPLGGVAGANVTIRSNPDANGQMFGSWSLVSGPGAIASSTAVSSTFTMGSGPASIRANFVPGYRLTTMDGVTSSAPGGLAGAAISLTAPSTPVGSYDAGWYLVGPGYILGDQVIMAASATSVGRGYLPSKPPYTSLIVSETSIPKNQPLTVTARVSDFHATPDEIRVEYSLDGGYSWTSATTNAGTQWLKSSGVTLGQAYPNTWDFPVTFPANSFSEGKVVFRAVGIEYNYFASVNTYRAVTVGASAVVRPAIVTQPTNQTATVGSSAAFSVVASGDALSYQWYKGGTPIAGRTNANLAFASVQTTDAGTYHVQVLNSAGFVNSSDVTLTVNPALDTTPPSVPSGLGATSIGASSFILSWTASTDNVGVTGYEVSRGGTSLGVFAGTSVNVSGLASSTGYQMTVRAQDAAGNWSPWSASLTVTTSGPGSTTTPDNDKINQLNVHIPF